MTLPTAAPSTETTSSRRAAPPPARWWWRQRRRLQQLTTGSLLAGAAALALAIRIVVALVVARDVAVVVGGAAAHIGAPVAAHGDEGSVGGGGGRVPHRPRKAMTPQQQCAQTGDGGRARGRVPTMAGWGNGGWCVPRVVASVDAVVQREKGKALGSKARGGEERAKENSRERWGSASKCAAEVPTTGAPLKKAQRPDWERRPVVTGCLPCEGRGGGFWGAFGGRNKGGGLRAVCDAAAGAAGRVPPGVSRPACPAGGGASPGQLADRQRGGTK